MKPGKTCVYVALLLVISWTRSADSQEVAGYDYPEIQCLAQYHYSGSISYLEAITTNLKINESKMAHYIITYSNIASGKICYHSKMVTIAGILHSHEFDVLAESACPIATDLSVSVYMKTANSINSPAAIITPIKIDGSNQFVNITFDKAATSITCTFINQPRKSRKSIIVKYGYCIPGSNLSSHVEGHILNSNSISLELNHLSDTSAICFVIEASNGTKVVNVVGKYDVSTDTSVHTIIFIITICLGLLAGSAILSIVWILYFHHKYIKSYRRDESTGEINFDLKLHMSDSDKKRQWKPIDLSTTYFKLLRATRNQKLHELFTEQIDHYENEDGHGFRKLTADELPISASKKIIVMDKTNEYPIAVTSAASIQKKFPGTYDTVYVRTRNYRRKVAPGATALYCARSKVIIAYQKVYSVTKMCKESEFVLEVIPGYQRDWIRFGYFQLIGEEDIKPYQQVIVQKMNDDLVIGPGVRRLLGAMSKGSTKIQPPVNMHNEWKSVFIQSSGDDRQLYPGTNYLFCALMEKVNAYYTIYDVKAQFNLAEFGRQYIPGFKPEMGYGYYEFKKEDEHFKPYKRVILIHKNKKLYTGVGAKFICVEGQYSKDVKSRKTKISPPNLANTDWMHIFIQSYSKKRELLPGTKFLYCEYK